MMPLPPSSVRQQQSRREARAFLASYFSSLVWVAAAWQLTLRAGAPAWLFSFGLLTALAFGTALMLTGRRWPGLACVAGAVSAAILIPFMPPYGS